MSSCSTRRSLRRSIPHRLLPVGLDSSNHLSVTVPGCSNKGKRETLHKATELSNILITLFLISIDTEGEEDRSGG